MRSGEIVEVVPDEIGEELAIHRKVKIKCDMVASQVAGQI